MLAATRFVFFHHQQFRPDEPDDTVLTPGCCHHLVATTTTRLLLLHGHGVNGGGSGGGGGLFIDTRTIRRRLAAATFRIGRIGDNTVIVGHHSFTTIGHSRFDSHFILLVLILLLLLNSSGMDTECAHVDVGETLVTTDGQRLNWNCVGGRVDKAQAGRAKPSRARATQSQRETRENPPPSYSGEPNVQGLSPRLGV